MPAYLCCSWKQTSLCPLRHPRQCPLMNVLISTPTDPISECLQGPVCSLDSIMLVIYDFGKLSMNC